MTIAYVSKSRYRTSLMNGGECKQMNKYINEIKDIGKIRKKIQETNTRKKTNKTKIKNK